MKNILKLFSVAIIFSSALAQAQFTTVVGSFHDPTGQAFVNGTYTITFVPTPGNPGPFTINGQPVNRGPFKGNLDAGGSFVITGTITDTSQILPRGTMWAFSICPNASTQCTLVNIPVSGNTEDVGVIINPNIPIITVQSSLVWPSAYQDTEVQAQLNGTAYFNTISGMPRGWFQGVWSNIGGGGTGGGNALSALTPATTTNTINNGNNQQQWTWTLTGTAQTTGLNISEIAPSTNTGTFSALLSSLTTPGSTVMPFRASNGGNGFGVNPNGDPATFGTATFRGPLVGNVTGNITGQTGNFTGLVNGGQLQATNLSGTHCLGSDATGNLVPSGSPPCGAAGPSSTALSALTSATATNTFDNAAFPQTWTWAMGNSGATMLRLGESATSTGTGVLLMVNTLNGSTAYPFCAFANLNSGYCLNGSAVWQSFGTASMSLLRTSGTGNQLQIGPSSTSGAWFNSDGNSPNGIAIFGGASKAGGVSWTAQNTIASGIGINNSPLNNGLINFYSNTGLTSGNTFTPTVVATLSPTGLFTASTLAAASLGGATVSCLQSDTSGNISRTGLACGSGSGGGTSLDAITSATAVNTLNNASFTQTWNWVLTGANNGFVINSGAGTGTGSLVQITSTSSTVTPLDVESPDSPIHFGQASPLGGWLTGGTAGDAYLSGGTNNNSTSWIAKGTAASILGVNTGNNSSFTFFGNTGLTSGSTFTPQALEAITPSGVNLLHNLYSGGTSTPANGILGSGTSLFLTGGGYFNGAGFIASATGAAALGLLNNGTIGLYANSSPPLVVGSPYTLDAIAQGNSNNFSFLVPVSSSSNITAGSLNVTGNSSIGGSETTARLAVTTGVSQNGGIKHQRILSCTTPATANGSCSTLLTWAAPFADTAYTATCTSELGGQVMVVGFQRIAASLTIFIMNWPGATAATAATIDCIAIHD